MVVVFSGGEPISDPTAVALLSLFGVNIPKNRFVGLPGTVFAIIDRHSTFPSLTSRDIVHLLLSATFKQIQNYAATVGMCCLKHKKYFSVALTWFIPHRRIMRYRIVPICCGLHCFIEISRCGAFAQLTVDLLGPEYDERISHRPELHCSRRQSVSCQVRSSP